MLAVALGMKPVAETVQERFGFRGFAPQTRDDNLVGLAFTLGAFKENGSVYPVTAVNVEERRIQLEIEGESKVANRFFAELARVLSPLLPNKPDLASPIYVAETTTSRVELNFSLSSLLDRRLRDFLSETYEPAIAKPGYRVLVSPRAIAINASWLPDRDPTTGVRVTDKAFNIEVRAGTQEHERAFFISSPTDSDTHLKLLEDLERRFA